MATPLRDAGWKTMLLVQFSPQYKILIITGIFLSSYFVLYDVAQVYAHADDDYTPSGENFLYALDMIFLLDFCSELVYKLLDWEDAKLLFGEPTVIQLLIEFFCIVPYCKLYVTVSHLENEIFYITRLRYTGRIIKLFNYVHKARIQVGRDMEVTLALECVCLLTICAFFFNLLMLLCMISEGFRHHDFAVVLIFTLNSVIGSGQSIYVGRPYKAMIPFIMFIFLFYSAQVYYTSHFICAILHSNARLHQYHKHVKKIVASMTSSRYHSINMEESIRRYFHTTWKKRKSVGQFVTFQNIVPMVMTRDLTLDVCWAAFMHSHIFRYMEIHYLRHLASLMQITFVTPGEIIYKKGKLKSKMIFLVNGVLQLLSEEDGETPILSLTGGTVLGETCLLVDYESSCTVICQSYGEMYVLHRNMFYKSYNKYPNEFRNIFKAIKMRYNESRDYVTANKLQTISTQYQSSYQVVIMRWLKETLFKNLQKEQTLTTANVVQIKLEEIYFQEASNLLTFCAKYLDLLVIADEFEIQSARTLLRETCPIVLQPDTGLLWVWNMFVSLLAYFTMLTFWFYVGVSRLRVNYYTIYLYFVTLVWITDVLIQMSTAIKTKHNITTKISKILLTRLSNISFLIDIVAAIPIEIIGTLCVGETKAKDFHMMQVNRLMKCYRIKNLFRMNETSSAQNMVYLKYLRFFCIFMLSLFSMAGCIYLSVCPEHKCSVIFIEYLVRRAINVNDYLKVIDICFFLSIQFFGGLTVGEFPVDSVLISLLGQASFYIGYMYMLADIAAGEAMLVKQKLKFHKLKETLSTLMKVWEFDTHFHKRVIKFCELHYTYDNASQILFEDKLLKNLPKNLTKIAQHIAFGKAVHNLPVFKGLPDEVIGEICTFMERIVMPPGEVITYSGEVCKEMYVIESGLCEMINQSKTTRKVIGPSDSFSVVEMCIKSSTVNTVMTLTDVKMLKLTYESYSKALEHYPDIFKLIQETVAFSFDWVELENLQMKETRDVESVCPEVSSFVIFFGLDSDSPSYDKFHDVFDQIYLQRVLKYLLMRMTIRPHGPFIKKYEYVRCFFAFWTVILNPIVVLHPENKGATYVLIFLDIIAWIDIYVRHHICYFDRNGIEVSHPLLTARNYWKHGFIIDLLGALPFNLFIPKIMSRGNNPKAIVYSKMNRLLQFCRVYSMFQFYIVNTGRTKWVIAKYFIMIVFLLNLFTAFMFNMKCQYTGKVGPNKEFIYDYKAELKCTEYSFLSPKGTFRRPISPERLYTYALYFFSTVAFARSLEGFTVFKHSEAVQVIFFAVFWWMIVAVMAARIIANVMSKNINLVLYQNAMKSLVKFMSYRKIDVRLRNEVIKHFEYIWFKKQGRSEKEIFQIFNTALHEDALYHIFGKVLQESSVFKSASKSFFKSLLLYVNHHIILNRGVISKVNNIHENIYIIFKGEVEILGPDYNRLLRLPVGSMFGNLDSVKRSRQTVTYVAYGHVELLAISSSQFHLILSKYREIRLNFRNRTLINVDYLINENQKSKYETVAQTSLSKNRISSYKSNHASKFSSSRFGRSSSKSVEKVKTCCRKMSCNLRWCGPPRIFNPSRVLKFWDAFILGGVCFIGSIIEIFQKNAEDHTILVLFILYSCDILFCVKIYLRFHTSFEDDRGMLVQDRKLIAKTYFNKRLGFFIDFLSTVPIEVVALFVPKDYHSLVWTYGRMLRLLRIFLVIDYFHSVSQKLNINVLATRMVYLMVRVTITLQIQVFIMFSFAKTDPSLEQYNASLQKNYRAVTYTRQIRVLLCLFSGSPVENFRPNFAPLVLTIALQMVITVFIQPIYIAEMCSTLDTVNFSKMVYSNMTMKMKREMIDGDVSVPLYKRIVVYMTLLWKHYDGVQYPILLDEMPYYLKEGILDSMFGFHLRFYPLLKKCHKDLIRQMAAEMKTRIFFSGDYITYKGDIDERMYFIHKGEVDVITDDTLYEETVAFTLVENQMFGFEQGMYLRCGHRYNYKAKTTCLIVMLKRDWWIHLLEFFPASKFLIYDQEFQEYLLNTSSEIDWENGRKPKHFIDIQERYIKTNKRLFH